jgi:predicted TIM-barrel fold metal-dependent hydrolase
LIIDTHVHIYPSEIARASAEIAEREPHFGAMLRDCGGALCTAEDLMAEMSGDGVAESWVCGFGFNDPGLCRISNDYACEAAWRSDGKLKWLCVVPPAARGAVAEIERCAVLGAIGVGEIAPDAQGWEIDERRETWRVAGTCHEHNMYLLVHVDPCGADAKVRAGDVGVFARNHPELVIVASCLGGGLFLCESMREARCDLRNVYYDTSAATSLCDGSILDAACRVAPRKIIFGSDFPSQRVARCMETLSEARLSDEDTGRLFRKNAREMLNSARVHCKRGSPV